MFAETLSQVAASAWKLVGIGDFQTQERTRMQKEQTDKIRRLTDEYIERDGFVTIEFSTSFDRLRELEPLLHVLNVGLRPYLARWVAYECNTCAGYCPTSPVHVEIMPFSLSGSQQVLLVDELFSPDELPKLLGDYPCRTCGHPRWHHTGKLANGNLRRDHSCTSCLDDKPCYAFVAEKGILC